MGSIELPKGVWVLAILDQRKSIDISRWNAARILRPDERRNVENRWVDASARRRGIRGMHIWGSVGGKPKYLEFPMGEGGLLEMKKFT